MAEPASRLAVVYFNPCEQIGIRADWATGLVNAVLPDGQAQRAGVKDGWRFVKAENEPYIANEYDTYMPTKEKFCVTFMTRVGDVFENVGQNDHNRPQSYTAGTYEGALAMPSSLRMDYLATCLRECLRDTPTKWGAYVAELRASVPKNYPKAEVEEAIRLAPTETPLEMERLAARAASPATQEKTSVRTARIVTSNVDEAQDRPTPYWAQRCADCKGAAHDNYDCKAKAEAVEHLLVSGWPLGIEAGRLPSKFIRCAECTRTQRPEAFA